MLMPKRVKRRKQFRGSMRGKALRGNKKRYDDSFKGYVDGIEYKLVSGDYLNFKPELVLR